MKQKHTAWLMIESQIAETLDRLTARYPSSKRIPILKKMLLYARKQSHQPLHRCALQYLALTKSMPPGFYSTIYGKHTVYFPGDRIPAADRCLVDLSLVHPQVFR